MFVVVVAVLWSLGQSQIVPYVFFMGQTLVNHSYVDFSLVRGDVSGNDSVQCHTDLSTCCSAAQGSHRGDWYFPNGDRVPFSSINSDKVIIESRVAQRVDLRRTSDSIKQTGIYRCGIETNAAHHSTDNSVRDTVYVGLYQNHQGSQRTNPIHSAPNTVVIISGDITVMDMTLSTDSSGNEGSLQFTLTCISTGGPATTVTWTKDSVTVTEGTQTVLNDPETAQYTHTLTDTWSLGVNYTCTVANNKPSTASATYILQGVVHEVISNCLCASP